MNSEGLATKRGKLRAEYSTLKRSTRLNTLFIVIKQFRSGSFVPLLSFRVETAVTGITDPPPDIDEN